MITGLTTWNYIVSGGEFWIGSKRAEIGGDLEIFLKRGGGLSLVKEIWGVLFSPHLAGGWI